MIAMKRLVALAAALVVIGAAAIEPPKPASPVVQPAEQPPTPASPEDEKDTEAEDPAAQPGQAPAPEAEDEEEEALPPLPADAAPAGPPPQRFNPTEKVRADFPVSFPIDI